MHHDLLAILAHPDDESFFLAGTASKLGATGRRAGLVCATRGQAGALGPGNAPPLATRDTVGAVREQELRTACARVALDVVAVLDYEDRQLAAADADEVRRSLVRIIRAAQPRVVATFDPGGVNGHVDHVAISRFALDAVTAAADARWFPDLGAAHRVSRVVWPSPVMPWDEWRRDRLGASGGVDFVIDVSDFTGDKEAALAAHRTQQGSIRPLWYDRARASGAGAGVFAVEAFRHGWGEPPPHVPAADLFEGLSAV